AIQTTFGGVEDAFVAKLNPAGSALAYSTYLGGSGGDSAGGSSNIVSGDIAVDSAGNAYVTGITSSTDFPTVSPFQATLGGGTDAFVAKLNSGGSALVYSTYLGGNSNDQGSGIAVDSSGNAYVTGSTSSANFPTTAASFQPALRGGSDAFIIKIRSAAVTIDFDGDGKADILWRNTNTGDNAIFRMNGFTLTSSALIPSVPTT